MRFVLRYNKSGRVSHLQIVEIEKRLKREYPGIEDVGFRHGKKVIFFKKRKQPYYERRRRDESGRLRKMRRPEVVYIPKELRNEKGYIIVTPIKKSGFFSRYRETHGVTLSRSSVINYYYYISLLDVADLSLFADIIASNMVRDFRKFRKPELFVARLFFIVRALDRVTRKETSYVFPRGSYIENYRVYTREYIHGFVMYSLRGAYALLREPSGKVRVTDVILEKHEVRNEKTMPMQVRNM